VGVARSVGAELEFENLVVLEFAEFVPDCWRQVGSRDALAPAAQEYFGSLTMASAPPEDRSVGLRAAWRRYLEFVR
jgi:hypothetical protein